MSSEPFERRFRAGVAQHRLRDFAGAQSHLQNALRIDPARPVAWFTLGDVYQDMHRFEDAADAYGKAISLRSDFAEAHHNLGRALREMRRFDEALERYRTAATLGLDSFELRSNLGVLFADIGDLDQSLAWFEKTLDLRHDPTVESNLVYRLHFHPDADPVSLARAHSRWNERYAEPLKAQIKPHANVPDPDRRLRIGYFSPDFRMHPVGFFINPLLGLHDRSQFEIVLYSDAPREDPYTSRFRSYADLWCESAALSHEQLAERIRSDRIDILVDLTMHMAGSRLLTFARKPAPVQVTYLAYCSTTGLETIDYRFSDPYLDPLGTDESVYSEKTIRLRSYWCYVAVADAPPVGPLPASASGVVTFGCLNHYSKTSPPALDAWCEILRFKPGSRLILHADEGAHRNRAWARMKSAGLDPSRLEFVPFLPHLDYLNTYNRIDVALDPFPYTGGTTTCDALWMGVPVVSFAGKTAVSRGGLSILSNLSLSEFVATDRNQYVQTALELAADLPRLANFRANLRQHLRHSPLCDARQFTRDAESAFRRMWKDWCNAVSTPPGRARS